MHTFSVFWPEELQPVESVVAVVVVAAAAVVVVVVAAAAVVVAGPRLHL